MELGVYCQWTEGFVYFTEGFDMKSYLCPSACPCFISQAKARHPTHTRVVISHTQHGSQDGGAVAPNSQLVDRNRVQKRAGCMAKASDTASAASAGTKTDHPEQQQQTTAAAGSYKQGQDTAAAMAPGKKM
jgi:hypothetical protein